MTLIVEPAEEQGSRDIIAQQTERRFPVDEYIV